MNETIHTAELHITGQPLEIVIFHKCYALALAMGASDDQAEIFSTRVAGHCRQLESVQIQWQIEVSQQRYMMIVASSNEKGWCEKVRLPTCPDQELIEQQQQSLADPSMTSLLRQMQQRQDLILQQRNHWKQESGNLATRLRRKNQDLQHQTMHDALTGLANRKLLEERGTHALQIARRQQFHCAMMVININDFKDINDAFGHHIGDRLLQAIAQRLKQALRNSDTLSRVSGDEFAVLLLNNDSKQAQIVSDKLQLLLAEPFTIDSHQIPVGIGIGIAEYPTHGEKIESLMRQADVALHHARTQKTDRMIYHPQQDRFSRERLAMIDALHHAIENDELELYYQPQISSGSQEVTLEALVRWPHPERGMIFPDQFIPLAEESGLITPMTWWVLKSAAAQCADWRDHNLAANISINFSPRNLQDDAILKHLKTAIEKHALPDNALIIEITESTLMERPKKASAILMQVDEMKVDVAIDDFGTGHSSLAYLKHLLVDELKIDRSFVMGMFEHHPDMVIVRTVINMAHNMGLRVVGEGVEDLRSFEALVEMGCDRMQGYFICRPQPVAAMNAWLKAFHQHGFQPGD